MNSSIHADFGTSPGQMRRGLNRSDRRIRKRLGWKYRSGSHQYTDATESHGIESPIKIEHAKERRPSMGVWKLSRGKENAPKEDKSDQKDG